jgi:hypothetical protein
MTVPRYAAGTVDLIAAGIKPLKRLLQSGNLAAMSANSVAEATSFPRPLTTMSLNHICLPVAHSNPRGDALVPPTNRLTIENSRHQCSRITRRTVLCCSTLVILKRSIAFRSERCRDYLGPSGAQDPRGIAFADGQVSWPAFGERSRARIKKNSNFAPCKGQIPTRVLVCSYLAQATRFDVLTTTRDGRTL